MLYFVYALFFLCSIECIALNIFTNCRTQNVYKIGSKTPFRRFGLVLKNCVCVTCGNVCVTCVYDD
jgi:hypothetical protein